MGDLAVRNLGKRFDSTWALREVTFGLAAGQKAVIVGPSGSGKTTLLRLIAGLEVPDEGEVVLDDVVASQPGHSLASHKRAMGMVFQSSVLWPHMTVSQNVRFGLAGWAKAEAAARVQEVLASVSVLGLAERYPDQISGGEARRVALARALAPRPRWLLFDEPLTNLDRELRTQLLDLIVSQVTTSEAGMIYVTHAEDEVEALAAPPAVLTVLSLAAGRLLGPGASSRDGTTKTAIAD